MQSELKDLYQDLILDHGRNPRNFREITNARGHADGYNPLCGDQVTVFADFDSDKIKDLAFKGKGCAISQASASLMTQVLKDQPRERAQRLFELVQKMVKDEATDADLSELGKLAALAGVKEFPSRVKCATLPWHTLIAALNNATKPVSTE